MEGIWIMYQAGPLDWQARQRLFEASIRVMVIELSALNQAHHSRTVGPPEANRRTAIAVGSI